MFANPAAKTRGGPDFTGKRAIRGRSNKRIVPPDPAAPARVSSVRRKWSIMTAVRTLPDT